MLGVHTQLRGKFVWVGEVQSPPISCSIGSMIRVSGGNVVASRRNTLIGMELALDSLGFGKLTNSQWLHRR